MKKLNGWVKVNKYNVYVENGFVTKATNSNGTTSLHVYRVKRDGTWMRADATWQRLTVSAVRAGLARETMQIA